MIAELRSRVPVELQPFEVQPREKRVKVEGNFARAAMRWPIGVWGTLDALAAFGGFTLAHYLSPQFSFKDAGGYQVGSAAAVFAVRILCLRYAQGLYDRQ